MLANRWFVAVLVLSSLVSSGRAQDDVVFRLRGIDRLKTLGASIGYDETRTDKPVIRIEMTGGMIDDDVARELRLFPDLETLTLAGTRVTDAGLDYLKALEKLKVVNLNYCPVTDRGLAVLRGGMCKDTLEVLNLSFTRVTDAGMAELAVMPKLKVLAVSQTRVSDDGLAQVAKIKNLTELYLDGTIVTRKGIDLLKDLPLEKLSYLDTRAATFGDDGFRKKR